jgi:LacI family transcriptional regulator
MHLNQISPDKKINIRELAKILNISVSTVSKAFRDSYEISDVTKKRVLETAERFNYTPNPYASSLRRKKSKTIAVILPEVADNFFTLAINGIQSVAEKKNYHLLIYLSHEKFNNEKIIIDDCSSGRVDGVLMSISGETASAAHLNKLKSSNIPLVFFDRALEEFDTAKVITNDYECGALSADLLVKRGCKKPVFLSISSCLPICQKRAEGFTNALAEKDAAIKKNHPIIYCTGKDEEEVYQQIKNLLASKNKPDGIVASVERIAMHVYKACHELNIAIPDDVKVIAFSTLETAPILAPSLTTITQPAFAIGKTAAEILFKAIEKNNYDLESEKIILPSAIIERASTS